MFLPKQQIIKETELVVFYIAMIPISSIFFYHVEETPPRLTLF